MVEGEIQSASEEACTVFCESIAGNSPLASWVKQLIVLCTWDNITFSVDINNKFQIACVFFRIPLDNQDLFQYLDLLCPSSSAMWYLRHHARRIIRNVMKPIPEDVARKWFLRLRIMYVASGFAAFSYTYYIYQQNREYIDPVKGEFDQFILNEISFDA